MPLKAVVDGETVIGPELSEEEWAELKRRHRNGLPVRMACCGEPGHLRVSKNGTQHFYHAADSGCTCEQESREHLEIKYQVYRACKAAGWETYVEYPAPDRTWISDVCAIKDGRTVVFEVQLSAIPPDLLEERDAKYRDKGIESYWLLDNFLDRSRVFASWYEALVQEEDARHGETIPHIDPALFATGTENQIFIAKGIRSAGLRAKSQTLFTTNNPEIPLAVWVREVLKGNYRDYLDGSAAVIQHRRRLKALAAPALLRFRDFYPAILRDAVYRKRVDRLHRALKTDPVLRNDAALQRKFEELYDEIDWLEKEYRSFTAEGAGLFSWKKMPGKETPRLFFRLESELKIRKLQECVERFNRWEVSFEDAISSIERTLYSTTQKK
jgi:competence protein CoiA